MDHKLWVGQRFVLNERGHYGVAATCGAQRIQVEIDPSAMIVQSGADPERVLMNMRTRIQAAARLKWEAGESYVVYHSFSNGIEHHLITLTSADLELE